MNRRSTYALLILGLLILTLACSSTRAPGTPPATPSDSFLTFTPVPTVTPFRSPTPSPRPSNTPTVTATPDDTSTPTPEPTPTPRPSFW